MDLMHSRMDWDLPCEPGSAALARRHVASRCTRLGREFNDVAVLLASELVGNAVEHAHGHDIHLVVEVQGSRFRVEVHDDADGHPAARRADALAPRGRGLMLLERLAAEWGVEPSPRGGKQVWFCLRVPTQDRD